MLPRAVDACEPARPGCDALETPPAASYVFLRPLSGWEQPFKANLLSLLLALVDDTSPPLAYPL